MRAGDRVFAVKDEIRHAIKAQLIGRCQIVFELPSDRLISRCINQIGAPELCRDISQNVGVTDITPFDEIGFVEDL